MQCRRVLKCETCGEEFPYGPGVMERADAHERNATQIDPEFRDHFVSEIQIEE